MDYDCESCEAEECNNKCILHCKKDESTQWYKVDNNIKKWDKEKLNAFWEKVRSEINYTKKSPNFMIYEKKIIFDNYIFPKFQTNYLFSRKQAMNSFFNQEKRIFDLKVIFKNCIFLDKADFYNITFQKGITFDNCTFENELNMSNMIFQKKAKLRIQNCPKIVNANFENTTFKDLADFYNSSFKGKETDFSKVTFEDISVFSHTSFKTDINFKFTTFNKLAQFKETKFKKTINLEDTIIKEEINFLKIKSNEKNDLTINNIANRETARIIKHSFEKQDNIIEANKFYALEMQKRENELNKIKSKDYNFWEHLVFKIHGISSNHSQDWLLSLLWIFNISFGYLILKSEVHYSLDRILIVLLTISFLGILSNLIKELLCISNINYLKTFNIFILFILATFSNKSLDTLSNLINPFSIMTIEIITIDLLLFKSIITYLIYQFITSIRQNTRRK